MYQEKAFSVVKFQVLYFLLTFQTLYVLRMDFLHSLVGNLHVISTDFIDSLFCFFDIVFLAT